MHRLKDKVAIVTGGGANGEMSGSFPRCWRHGLHPTTGYGKTITSGDRRCQLSSPGERGKEAVRFFGENAIAFVARTF